MIEKNIFQSWHTTNLHPIVKKNINKFKNINPEYKYFLFTDKDMDNFVYKYFPGEFADCYYKLNIIVAKVDFCRYLVLYNFGGVYLDMDSNIKRSLRELIKNDDNAIISSEGNFLYYVQWALIFSKNHPILKKTIDLIIQNIKNNTYPNNIHKMTGPTVFTQAVNNIHFSLFNNNINQKEINKNTNITHLQNNIKYRFFGIDYNGFIKFKDKHNKYLYKNKMHWTKEQTIKKLLI